MAYSNIDKPSKYFNTVLYTGTGASNSVTGVGFAPYFVWIKNRDNAGAYQRLVDAVRGATKLLYSNGTNAEDTDLDSLTSFNVDGFTVGTSGGVNQSGQNIVSWNWLANGAGVSNTSGSITSTVSANTTSGFSIVSWTGNGVQGATVGHGLGVVPKMVIAKSRGSAQNWWVTHANIGATQNLWLNSVNAVISDIYTWASRASSTVLNIGDNFTNGTSYIAYCFNDVKGYSKFGSYVGNGSADGTFVYTGFKPAFVMEKSSSVGGYSWAMSDNKRNPFNQANNTLFANATDAEYTSLDKFDLLSNGFKLRSIYGNTTGDTYIYMAFADSPFVSSKAIPTTAR